MPEAVLDEVVPTASVLEHTSLVGRQDKLAYSLVNAPWSRASRRRLVGGRFQLAVLAAVARVGVTHLTVRIAHRASNPSTPTNPWVARGASEKRRGRQRACRNPGEVRGTRSQHARCARTGCDSCTPSTTSALWTAGCDAPFPPWARCPRMA